MKKLLSYLLLSLGVANLYGPVGVSASELGEQVDQAPAFPKAEERLHASEITPKTIEKLKGVPHLNLKITGDRDKGMYLTLDAMSLLGALTNLERLDLSNQLIMKEGFKNLAQLTNLTSLNLNFTNTTDADLASLAGLQNLRDLKLAYTQITDAAFVPVGKLQALEFLNVNGTKVSDSGLKNLNDLKHLQNILAIKTAITQKAKDNLFKQIHGQ